MIGFSPTLQFMFLMITVGLGLLLLVMQGVRLFESRKEAEKSGTPLSKLDLTLWVCEFLTCLGVLACVIAVYFLYQGFIPSDSPGCLPYVANYGVVASNVDPVKYYVNQPPILYPATTYNAAVIAYQNSPNGLSTGYFSWDGVSVAILNTNANELALEGAPPGTSWVFEDLNTAVLRISD